MAVCADRRSGRRGRERVEPVFRDVGVERAQVDGRELVDGLEGVREVVGVVRASTSPPRRRIARARTGRLPASGQRDAVDRRIEVVQIRRQVSQCVPDLAIGLDDACRICLPSLSSSRKSPIVTHRRRVSAPLSLMMSCGSMELPSDLDILWPSTSMMKPCVTTSRNGGRPACRGRPATSSGTSRGADRCLRDTCPPATSARAGTAAPLRGSIRSRTRRRGCRAPARTRCRRRSDR